MNWSTASLADHYRKHGVRYPVQVACGDGKRRSHKYNARKTEVDGIVFDSAREAHHYRVLKILEEKGIITTLELQPRFVLQEKQVLLSGKTQRAIVYKADFQFIRDGKPVVADVKGMLTPVFRMKEKMFRVKYPDLNLEIWK